MLSETEIYNQLIKMIFSYFSLNSKIVKSIYSYGVLSIIMIIINIF